MRSTADEIEPSVAEQAMKPASFEDFYFDHHRDVYAAMWLVTRDRHEAEEITQDAFLRVLERWDRVAAMNDPTG
jgi:RNA polymerase sigma-70 factor, ECF subfamily